MNCKVSEKFEKALQKFYSIRSGRGLLCQQYSGTQDLKQLATAVRNLYCSASMKPAVTNCLFTIVLMTFFVQVTESFAQPPSSIFHYGAKDVLKEDMAAHNVPQFAWDTFIMGIKTTWDLPRYRRGFYGSEMPWVAAPYASVPIPKGRSPWVVEIKIKPKCLAGNETLVFENLDKEPRLLNWLSSLSPDLTKEFLEKCFIEMDGKRHYYGAYRSLMRPEGICESLLHDFMQDKKIKVVEDHVFPKSWYVRDRNCIEDIVGGPFRVASWTIEVLVNNRLPSHGTRAANLSIFFDAAFDLVVVGDRVLQRFEALKNQLSQSLKADSPEELKFVHEVLVQFISELGNPSAFPAVSKALENLAFVFRALSIECENNDSINCLSEGISKSRKAGVLGKLPALEL